MSTNNNDGGPAFPYAFQHQDDSRFLSQGFAPGMSLRDYFAGQALAGLLAQSAEELDTDNLAEEMRVGPWAIADAMLAARTKETNS